MAQAIYDGNLEHAALSDSAIQAIIEQLCKHPAIEKMINPVVTPEDLEKNSIETTPQ
jgi:hypothetical protein